MLVERLLIDVLMLLNDVFRSFVPKDKLGIDKLPQLIAELVLFRGA